MNKKYLDAFGKWLMTDPYFEYQHRYYEAVFRIKLKLDKQSMLASETMRILNVSRRQLFYWGQHGMKITKERGEAHSWRRFSVIDLLGFAVLKNLTSCGFKIGECKEILDSIRENVLNLHFFVSIFAKGEDIYVIVDINTKEVDICYGFELRNQDPEIRFDIDKPAVVIPISHLLRKILTALQNESFAVECAPDDFGRENRIVFKVDDETIDLDKLEQDLKESLKKKPDEEADKSTEDQV